MASNPMYEKKASEAPEVTPATPAGAKSARLSCWKALKAMTQKSSRMPIFSTAMIAVARALLTAPAAGVAAAFSAARSLESTVRWAARSRGYVSARATSPEGASASVRELASVRGQSPFQRMDVSRYLKTIQERIGTGALQALSEKGHDTGQLEQQIVQVSNGGVFIGTMSGGAVATGRGARARADGALQQVIGRQDGR